MGRPKSKKKQGPTNERRRKSVKSVSKKRTRSSKSLPNQSPQETSSYLRSISEQIAGDSDLMNCDNSPASGPIVKNLKVCSESCSCPRPVTWYVCKYCSRAYETNDGLRQHRSQSLTCHKRRKSKVLAQLNKEKNSRRVSETESKDFEISDAAEELQTLNSAVDVDVDDGNNSDSSTATVFVIHKNVKNNVSTISNGYTDTPGPSSHFYNVNQSDRRTIQLSC